jgi:hypothetical protein
MIHNAQKQIIFPDEFSGNAQKNLFNCYGDPRTKGWGSLWLLSWKVQLDFNWFPAPAICVHKAFKPRLYNAFKQLENIGIHHEIKSFEEAFCIRFIIGSSSVLSVHSWGAAIDLNVNDNPLGSEGAWSSEFIDTMLQNGVFSGQRWYGRKDPMHFSMVNG